MGQNIRSRFGHLPHHVASRQSLLRQESIIQNPQLALHIVCDERGGHCYDLWFYAVAEALRRSDGRPSHRVHAALEDLTTSLALRKASRSFAQASCSLRDQQTDLDEGWLNGEAG